MHPTDQQTARRPLHCLDQLVVSLRRADELACGLTERMCSGADQGDAAAVGLGAYLIERRLEVSVCFRRRVADTGDDLDRALEQLMFGLGMLPSIVACADRLEQLGRRRDQVARTRIDEVQLELDSDRRSLVAREADRHGGSAATRSGPV